MIIIASTNKNKIKEFNKINSHFDFDVIDELDVDETGSTFLENAYLKAKTAFDITHKCVMADDSGIEVLALKGFPGIFSSRFENGRGYATTHKDLIERLSPFEDKRARYVCAICLIDEFGNKYSSIGYCNGKIASIPRGDGGFGYDPIFIPDGYNMTFGELGEEVKNVIGHRAKAFNKLIEQLPLKFMRRHYHD